MGVSTTVLFTSKRKGVCRHEDQIQNLIFSVLGGRSACKGVTLIWPCKYATVMSEQKRARKIFSSTVRGAFHPGHRSALCLFQQERLINLK